MINKNKIALYTTISIIIYLVILVPLGFLFNLETRTLIIRAILGSIFVGATCLFYFRNKNNVNNTFNFLEVYVSYFKVLMPIALVFGIISLFMGFNGLINKGFNYGTNYFLGMGCFLVLTSVLFYYFLKRNKNQQIEK